MCKPASFVVTKDRVFWSKSSDSHEAIIKEHGLSEGLYPNVNYVRVELYPEGGEKDLNTPVKTWVFKTDQDVVPSWYDPKEVEKRVRQEARRWVKARVIKKGEIEVIEGHVYLYGNATATLRNNATATLYGNAAATLRDNATATLFGNAAATLRDNATATLFGNATATLRDNAAATLFGNATAILWDNAAATLFGNATAILWDNATATLRENATAILWENATATLMGNATATLRGDATAILMGDTTATLRDNATATIKSDNGFIIDRRSDGKPKGINYEC